MLFRSSRVPSGAVLFATALAVLLIFPSLGVLYRLGQKGLLPDEGVDDEAPSMA